MDERVKIVFGLLGGLAMFLYGMNSMSDALQKAAGEKMKRILGFLTKNPLMGALAGALVTAVLQSSSATIAVLQNFASQPGPDGIHSVIGLAGAIPILFGDNIGTTITALLASIGQSKNAKRTAIAHSTFNITGTILFMFLIRPLAAFVQWISPKGDELDIISRQIANAHTTFNVACTLIWLPLIPVMVKIVKFIIRGEDKKNSDGFVAKYLDDKAMSQPAAAIYMAAKEISRLSVHAGKMIGAMKNAIEKRNITDIRDKYVDEHDKVKELQNIIVDFITKLISSGNLTEKQAEQAAGLMVVSNNIERIADRCDEVDGLYKKILDNGQLLSDAAIADLTACMDMTEKLFGESMNAIITGDSETPDKVAADKKKIRKLQRQAGKAHLARVKKNTCVRSLTADYSALLYSMDRMADNCISIAEEAIDDFTFDKLDIENMDSDSEVMVKAGAQA